MFDFVEVGKIRAVDSVLQKIFLEALTKDLTIMETADIPKLEKELKGNEGTIAWLWSFIDSETEITKAIKAIREKTNSLKIATNKIISGLITDARKQTCKGGPGHLNIAWKSARAFLDEMNNFVINDTIKGHCSIGENFDHFSTLVMAAHSTAKSLQVNMGDKGFMPGGNLKFHDKTNTQIFKLIFGENP